MICGSFISKNYRKLSKIERSWKIELAKKGDVDAQDEIVLSYLPMIMDIMHKYVKRSYIPDEDLFQDCVISIISAIHAFDPVRSDNITPMVYSYIRSCLMKSLGNKQKYASYTNLRIPKRLSEHIDKLNELDHQSYTMFDISKNIKCSHNMAFNVAAINKSRRVVPVPADLPIQNYCDEDRYPLVILHNIIKYVLSGKRLKIAVEYFIDKIPIGKIAKHNGLTKAELSKEIKHISAELKNFGKIKRHCKKCDKLFHTKNIKRQYCSQECRGTYSKPKQPKSKTCKHCGRDFLVSYPSHDGKQYCSRNCYHDSAKYRNQV
jgi:RNA polymerase sigma factor (sigma-70 family)